MSLFSQSLRRGAGFLLSGALLVATAVPGRAATFTVTTTADAGPGSLRQAITDANATTTVDRIQFAIPAELKVNGVWTIQPLSALPEMPNPVFIVGPGSNLLTLKGAGLTVQQPAAPVQPGYPEASPQYAISGLTIRDGGGIFSLVTRLRLDDVRLINNRAGSRGGGVSSALSILSVNNCVFEGNHGSSCGGGLAVWAGGEAVISNSDFIGNDGGPADNSFLGGAIHCDGKMTVSGCRFLSNTADMGTAISVESSVEPYTRAPIPGGAVITNCTFENNIQRGVQNALYNWGGTIAGIYANISLGQCTFRGNSVGRGGAVYAQGRNSVNGNVKLDGCLIQGNSSLAGSAVFNEGGLVTLVNTTIADNHTSSGGAIQDRKLSSLVPITTLVNTTFSRNGQAGSASEVHAAVGSVRLLNTLIRPVAGGASLTRDTGSFISLGHNLSEDNGGGFLKAAGDKVNTPSKLDTVLRNNGGPTRTLALLAGSPAIDAGDDSVLGSPYKLTSDQRPGFARKSGTHVDIGAYEYQEPSTLKMAPNASANTF